MKKLLYSECVFLMEGVRKGASKKGRERERKRERARARARERERESARARVYTKHGERKIKEG